MGASAFMVLAVVLIVGWVTLKGYWPYLWHEWLTSVDHKRIGVMYCVLALVMMLRGFSDAIMMRAQQAFSGRRCARLSPVGAFRPDLLGARHHHDLLYGDAVRDRVDEFCGAAAALCARRRLPTLNSVSFWLTASGALLINISLAIGEFAKTGWMAYPPLSELQFSPGVGVDYYLWSLQISGIGTLLAESIRHNHPEIAAPGMGYMRMPVFCWTALATNLLIVAAFPVLTAALAMLLLDRYPIPFFTIDGQGNQMLYVNLFWVWGHPEVYILILPALACFRRSSRPSPASRCSAIARWWARPWRSAFFLPRLAAPLFHHGRQRRCERLLRRHEHDHRSADRRQSLQLAVHDVWRARSVHRAGSVDHRLHGDVRHRRFTGVLLAVPPIDFQVHNSLFLVAHFHNVIMAASCLARWRVTITGFQGLWLPSSTKNGAGPRSGAGWSASTSRSLPLYCAGPDGHDPAHAALRQCGLQPWLIAAAIGAIVILAGIVCQIVQLVVSIRRREQLCDVTGDPWNARTPGMGHRVAAAGLELRDPAACRPDRCFLDQQTTHGSEAG